MEFLLDTANLEEIEKYVDLLPLSGVTTNPTIIKKEGKMSFFKHMNAIRSLIGKEKSLHVQVVATDYQGMIQDAERLTRKIDADLHIKVPTTEVGLKVMKELKNRELNVTATAIYTTFQAYLAIAAGVDYIAPYVNRMENANICSIDAIQGMANEITKNKCSTKILAASFKNVAQVNQAIASGAHAATMGGDILKQAFGFPSIHQAVNDFSADWASVFGEGKMIYNLED